MRVDWIPYASKKILASIPLLFGVTFISFLLMVYFGPDLTYSLLGKNPTQADIDQIRHQLGYDRSLWLRYLAYLSDAAQGQWGTSSSSHEPVLDIIKRTLPISLYVNGPGFMLGNMLALILGLAATSKRGLWLDRCIMLAASVTMSLSFLIIIILLQYSLCSSFGLNLLPVQGWDMSSWSNYLRFVSVPTLALILVTVGYSTRFFRAILVEEINKDHVRTALAYGSGPLTILCKHVLKNSLVPIITRLIFSIPFVFIEGSLLIENFFGIPGIGQVTYVAIMSGDLPLLRAIVSLSAIVYVVILLSTDLIYKLIDPRISLA